MKISPSLISFIARSKRRKEVLQLLKERLSQPEIRKLSGMYKAHTSRTLKELLEHKLIVCANPEDRAFKFYQITKLGKKALEEAEKIISD